MSSIMKLLSRPLNSNNSLHRETWVSCVTTHTLYHRYRPKPTQSNALQSKAKQSKANASEGRDPPIYDPVNETQQHPPAPL